MKKSRLLLLLVGLFFSFISLSAQAVWDGTVATSFAGGTGTEDDPYLISNGAELAYLAQIAVNSLATEGKFYRLTEDIILNEDVLNEDYSLNGTPANPFKPISYFYGTFDGNGHVISGLYINDSSGTAVGLFGSFYGLVYDLAVVDAYIYGTWSTGIIVGNGYGGAGISMTRCYAAGNVTGYYAGLLLGGDNGSSTIEYCYCAGVVSSSHCAGGIAGDVYNNVNHCFAVAKLTSGSGLIDFTHGSTFAHLYYDKDICNLNSVINETCYGKSTEEMQSEEFAELLGAPFVYVNGNYPYIEGLPMVGELTSNTSGYRLNVGTLTNGKGSKVKYYREYDGTDVSKATSRSEAGETVYVKVTPRIRMLLTGGAPVVTNNTTEGAVTLTALANGIWSFTMPESDVSVTASFYRDPDAPIVWDGTVATTFAGGLGTESNPYKISNGAELAYLAKIVNENIESTEGKYYMLVNDIVLNEEVLTRDFYLNGTPENAWIPIGSGSAYYFKGTLDGDYHVISGLYIENMYGDYSGFIGNLYGGAVKNLSLVDAYGSGSEVGLLVARIDNNSLVSQCYVEGFADGGSYSSTLISVSDYNISGSSSVIEYCYTSGRTNTSSMRPACFISYQQNNTIMRNCYSVAISTTAINGLVAGDNMLNVYVCSNNCTPFSYNDTFCSKSREEMMSEEFAQLLGEPFEIGGDNYPYIPGLAKVGEKQSSPITGYRLYVGELTNSKGCTVKYYRNYDGTDVSKATSRAEAGETVYLKVIPRKRMLLTGGAPVVTDAADGSVKLTALSDSIWSFTMPESAVTVTANFYKDPNAPNVWDGSVADSFAGGTGTQDDPYLISDGAELAYLSKIANDNPNSTAGQYYQLVSDIVLNEDVLDENFDLKNGVPANLWTPIVDTQYSGRKDFQGDFNGNGHIISGLYAERTSYPQYVGLFGSVGGNGRVHDLAIIDSYILCQYTGGLIAGTITGKATISRCYVEGRMTGYCQYAGLLVGSSNATIEYCYSSGYNDGQSAHSGLLGITDGGNTHHCFTAARVLNNGNSRTGAIIGWVSSGDMFRNCYYDNTKEEGVKAIFGSDKETCYGLTTEKMQEEKFATLLGEPFVFAEGNYPYIEGLPRVGETEAFNPAGSRISVGTLTNGGGSSIRFYREYQDGTLKRRTSYAEAGETIYMQLNIRKRMLLTEGSLKLLNDETGQTVALTSVGENIWSFTMPESPVTVTAAFYRDPTVPPLWDGSVAEAFAEGDGTEEDPYIIHDGEELAYLAQLTNANADLTKNKYFELGADIYLNDIMLNDELELEGTPDNEWTPIGNSSNAFRGHFDGKDHIISGLYTNGGDYRGLFGVVEGATIQDLNIIDSYVKGNVIGALAGSMGRNDSCFVSRCYIEATLDPTGSSAGLITGLTCYLNMKNCYTNGQVKNSYSYRGSLVGQIYNSPTITNCFTVVKGAQPLGNMNANGNTNNVYFDSDFFGSTYTNRDNFRSATNIEMFTTDFAERMGEPYEYVLGNYPYIPGLMKVGENRGWESPTDPTHGGAGDVWDGERSIIFASGTGTETDPYIINNGAQLAYLAKLTNANANLTKNRYFELGADIVLNENVLDNDFELKDTPANVWEPIGYSTSNVFRGHFDGKGHNISGIYTNGGDYRGLFGIVEGSTICNLNIIDSYVAGSTIGALAGSLGRNDSCFVSRCYVEATLYPTSSNSGLIAGMTCYLNMEECYVNGQVKNSYSYRGGLLGYMVNSPTVTNCYAVVKNVQAAGNVNNGGNFYNVYYDSDIAGSTHKTSEYFRGATTVEMLSTDFATRMGEPYEYALGYYPFIYGMHKINKDGKTVIVKGYSLQLGTLTNGKNCNISFYRTYVKKTNTLDNQVIAGSKVMLEGPTAIYAKLDIDATKRLSDDGLIVKTITGESIEVSKVDDDLYMFTMPENTITVSAKFVTGGFCGNPEVNNGRDMMWQLSDDQNTLTISGTGEMYSNAWTTYASNVTAIEVNEGVTGVKAQAFKGMNKVTTATLPETLETIGSEAFSGCTATVDLRPCTLLTTLHANEFAQFAGTTLWLPATVTSIEANTFTGSTVEHVYSPIEDGQSLYANNNQVLDVNGYGDIRSYVTTADLVVTLTRGTGYMVHIGTTTGGGLKFFADEALTTEIPNGYKAIRNNDNTRVYIKVAPNAGTILLKSGLTVSCASGNIATTQEGDEVFSFIMPNEAITATAQFTKGGYSGKGDVNSGHNLIWTLIDGTLAFQKNPMAQGSNLDMGDFTSTGTPWNGSEVTTLDLGDATSIGNDAFAGCTALVGIELSGAPIAIGSNAFAKSTWIIVPVATYSVYQTEWAAYSDQIVKDKETLSMNEGQQWRTFYSKVGRKLPTGLLAYTVKSINGNKVITDTPIDYVPANEAVLIEHSDKTALTTEATTTIAPYSTVNQTPVCNMTTEQANLLQWLTAPKSVSVGDGYTLYKDEFVMVSSGTLPAGVAFLPEPSAKNAPRLTIYKGETTEIDIVNGEGLSVNGEADAWYTIDGKKMGGKPEKKGMYIHNGQKVVIK